MLRNAKKYSVNAVHRITVPLSIGVVPKCPAAARVSLGDRQMSPALSICCISAGSSKNILEMWNYRLWHPEQVPPGLPSPVWLSSHQELPKLLCDCYRHPIFLLHRREEKSSFAGMVTLCWPFSWSHLCPESPIPHLCPGAIKAQTSSYPKEPEASVNTSQLGDDILWGHSSV